jgi:lysophospholipase L1-like esterase
VTFGDSTASIGALTSPANQDIRFGASSAWQSGTVTLTQYSDKFLTYAFYPQAYCVGNGGISGQNTAQMLARDTASASSTRYAITDMLALSPEVCLLRGGSINDITNVTNATLSSTVATTYANHVAIINRFAAANVFVIDCGIYGYSGTGATDLAATRSAIVQLNNLFAAYALANPTKVAFVSPTGIVSDSTGAYLPGMSQDGIHLNFTGSYLTAQQEAQVLTATFGPSLNYRYQGTNVFADPFLLTTSSPSYGTLCTSMTTFVINGTRANAQIRVINGQILQTVDFIPSGAGTLSGGLGMAFNPTSTGTMAIQPGDVWGVEFDFYLSNLTGGTFNINNFSPTINIYDSTGSGQIIHQLITAYTSASTVNTFQGHIAFPMLMFGDSSANFTTSSGVSLNFGTDSVTSLRIGVGNVRYVKIATNTTYYQGNATLVAGSVTVANTNVQAGSKILVTQVTPGGTPGALYVGTITAGTSFVINSTSALDTSVVRWEIVGPNI